MSGALDESLRGLDGCGCCAGVGARIPEAVENRPGLPAIGWRVGTHASFRAHLLAALSAGTALPLRALSARAGDFTIALLDAWAAVGDVLTFYQERIANESWLRTATERRSVLELARSIGYELAPGVAAATPLAFTLEDVPGAPERVTLARGTQVQSIPAPGERPQTFETVEAVEARPAWNAWRPRLSRAQPLGPATKAVWVRGAPAPVVPGDVVLFVAAPPNAGPATGWAMRTVRAVTVDDAADRTRVELETPLGSAQPTVSSADSPELYVLRARGAPFGQAAPEWKLLPQSAKDEYGKQPDGTVPTPGPEWPNLALPTAVPRKVDLDAVYPGVLADSWLVMSDPPLQRLYRVQSVMETARSEFALSARITRATVDSPSTDPDFGQFAIRRTAVFAQSESLPLAEEPDSDPISGSAVELDGPVFGLPIGRLLIVRGRRIRVRLAGTGHQLVDGEGRPVTKLRDGGSHLLLAAPASDPSNASNRRLHLRDGDGNEGYIAIAPAAVTALSAEPGDAEIAEAAVLERADTTDPAHTKLVFAAPLERVYDRATVAILGNVAPATHGETVEEALGNGDASVPFQRFALRQPPLTHVPDASPSGAASTLEVRVGEVLWREVPSLFGRGAHERVHVTRLQDDGSVVVQFGDGHEGARLPSGHENVRAAYRRGIGVEGNLAAGQLSLLMTQALGVEGVENPLPATGGADPQSLDDARDNAPLTVLTLERVVSLRDYEDFARTFAGIAKAQAVWSWDGGRRGVFLTVAGPGGAAVADPARVAAAIARAGDPHVPLRAKSYRRRAFRVTATLRREGDRLDAAVLRDAEAALRARFAFAVRGFGQGVAISEVVAALQRVPGVAWVDLDLLYREGDPPSLSAWLPADAPVPGGSADTALPAELLVLDLRPGDLRVAP